MKKGIKVLLAGLVILMMNMSTVYAAEEYTDNELYNMAYHYYKENNYEEYREIQSDIVMTINEHDSGLEELRLYMDAGMICEFLDLYYIDRTTGIGVDLEGNIVDLRKSILYQAMDLYTDIKFANNTSTYKYRNDILDENGYGMMRIGFYNIDTYSGMEKYLDKTFNIAITKDLLSEYRNVNDKLYRLAADRGSDITVIDWECMEVFETDVERYFKVKILIDEDYDQTADTYEICHFIQCKIDGEWIFTDFPYFY